MCVWELLTGELPYKNVDSSAIIWGVGSNSLQLPLPSSCPDGFKLLIKQCWSSKVSPSATNYCRLLPTISIEAP